MVSNQIRKDFNIRCFIGDSPACAFVSIMGHGSYEGCPIYERRASIRRRDITNAPHENARRGQTRMMYQRTSSVLHTGQSFAGINTPGHHHPDFRINPSTYFGKGWY